MDKSALSLVFINGAQVEVSLKWNYQSIFHHWHSIWSQTFKEVDEAKTTFSDQFTRQDEIMGLFFEGRCIAACCHRVVDLSLSSFNSDSYFEPWPAEAISKLRRDGDLIVIDSQISVDPNFRKLHSDIRIIELMTLLSLRHLTVLPVASITAAARNLRSMNEMFEKFAPETLVPNVTYHGEETSLYAFYPRQVRFDKTSAELVELADDLLAEARRSKFINPILNSQAVQKLFKKTA